MNNFPKLFSEVFDFCKKYGEPFFTGSRAMGLENPDSDWDIVTEASNEDIVEISNKILYRFDGKLINYFDVYPCSNLTRRFIIEIETKKFFGLWKGKPIVHVIVENSNHCNVERWKLATECCKADKEYARDKECRINIFKSCGVPQNEKEEIFI